MDLLDYLIARAELPLRVRVNDHALSDRGREGDLTRITRTRGGGISCYVDNMTEGDDGNPSRYHQPRSLDVLDDAR